MSFSLSFRYPFYTGGGSSSSVPDLWDVAINGHPFMVDVEHAAFKQGLSTIPLLRPQMDSSSQIGQASVNPDDLWPRTQQSWHHGAGQEFLDRTDADNQRFWTSFGVDVWTQGQIKTLNATRRQLSSSATNLQVLQAGNYTYLSENDEISWTTDLATSASPSYTPVGINAGEGSKNVTSMTTDGNSVWAAVGTNGVHVTTRGAVSSSHYSALQCTLLGYVKGRLMAANANNLYNITAGGAAPAALFTHPNSDFRWVGFAGGQGFLYAAGFSGDKSLIYKTAVVADGTTLAVPTVAGELPDGEIVRSIQGYLGFLIAGTDKGFRLATSDGSGNLTFGALVQTPSAVLCFEPQDRFCWFGWSNFDDAHTGLGRMDLSVFTAPNVAAYASDLMCEAQGFVTSTCTVAGNFRAYTVAGAGLYCEYAATDGGGWLETGKLDFGIGDDKIALRLKLRHQPLDTGESVAVDLSADGENFLYVGVSNVIDSTSPGESFRIGAIVARTFNLRLTLANDAVVERYDLQAYPATIRRETIMLPLLLSKVVRLRNGTEIPLNPRDEYDYIRSFVGSNAPVNYQELGSTYTVFIEEVAFEREGRADTTSWWTGTAVLKLKALGD